MFLRHFNKRNTEKDDEYGEVGERREFYDFIVTF